MKQLRGFNDSKESASSNTGIDSQILAEAKKKYGGMDETALINTLLNNVKAQKQNGTYNEAQLLSFVNSVSPQLTAEQRARLESVITVLSNENV